MNITPAIRGHRRTTDYEAARIAELAAGRYIDPHAAQVAELLGCSFEHAALNDFHRRLAILRDLYKHMQLERIRGNIGSWLYSPARLEAIREAMRNELRRLNTVPATEAELIFAEGYVPQIAAAAA